MMADKTTNLCNKAISDLQKLFQEEIANGNSIKAQKIAYWLSDYVSMLREERTFNSRNLKKYTRGDIVKVHLGFRIGSEEGGLHFCIVLDNNNNIASPTLTVVPLTSLKPNVDVTKLGPGRLYLGSEVYDLLTQKANDLINKTFIEIAQISGIPQPPGEMKRLHSLVDQAKKTIAEVSNMKSGSIALLNQIVTVSKIRIYDPLSTKNTLHGIRVSNETLDAIDERINNLYTKTSN